MPEGKQTNKQTKMGETERKHFRNMSFHRNVKVDYYACYDYEHRRSSR